MYESMIQQERLVGVLQTQPVLISVPLSKGKLRKRGHNQATILAEKFAKKFKFRVYDCLERTKETKPQFGLSKEERKENMKEAFGIKSKELCRKENVQNAFLIDDVLTTGSTLLEAARVLKRNGFQKIYGICLARDE